VIAVTDGADYCPNKTRAAAKKLREEYGALFLGIGVGFDCKYDKNFVEGLTSIVGDKRAYYDVTDYSAIKQVAEQILTPLCDEFHSACGPDCHGFCGCGDCFCPECDSTGSKCNDYRCSAGGGASNGCVITDIDTCPENDTCTQYTCDDADGDCTEVKTCAEVEAKNPGTCRSVGCNLTDGTCKVEYDHEYCSNKFDTACEKYECAGENVTSGVGYDGESGCILKRSITQECHQNMTYGCWKYSCDAENGTCVRDDTCKSQNTACMTYKCNEGGECEGTPIPPPAANTSCREYQCDDKSGWYISLDMTAQSCRENASDKSCKIFRCDVEEGCTYDTDEDCSELCNDTFTQDCIDEGNRNSTVGSCLYVLCRAHDVNGEPEPYCQVNKTLNCLESEAAEEARRRNANNSEVCFTVDCSFGDCIVVPVPKPTEEGKRDTACQKNVCEFTKEVGWNWVLRDTQVKTSCVSDECFSRECDAELGCVWTDICRSRTTECTTYTCEEKKCVSKNVTLKETDCTFEECENDHIVTKPKDIEKACPNDNKCKEVLCSELGECIYRDKAHGNDPCQIYECYPEEGWKSRPKCDDGLFCTADKCTVNGECRYTPVDCYLELNMSEYPCFRAVCKEDKKNSQYQCTRKKIEGVYIDMCGNCIREDGTEGSSDESLGEAENCGVPPDEYIPKKELAAATIAMIVLGAIIIGAAVASTTVLGTKALLERAREANNQSAHSNPLFEGDQTEMSNPAFAGEDA
jgi:hypothetical protein